MLEELQHRIQYFFENQHLLECAMTHKSCKKHFNNERLEFLGDAVIALVVGEYLYSRFPHYQEGKLSKIRAHIVNEEGLAKFARHIQLNHCIALSMAEENNKGREKPSILSDAFEALIGAVFLEKGLQKAQELVTHLIDEFYSQVDFECLVLDYKTSLQEITQAKFGIIPEYILIQETGPDHQKTFEMAIKIANQEYARAIGNSKKQAQQECAKLAYEMLQEV